MSQSDPHWQITGEYFENCNCAVLCPCLVSTSPPLSARPTEGHCAVAFAFHIVRGRFGEVALDGLNAAVIAYAPGPMADGNWSVGAYIDRRADEPQANALGAIFGGDTGGPMAAFAPLIANRFDPKRVPITYRVDGKKRSVEIPDIMRMAVQPLPTARADGESWVAAGHPFNPDKLFLAMGEAGSMFYDHGMRWDNSGKNGHYAAIAWSN